MFKKLIFILILLPQAALANFEFSPSVGLYRTKANQSFTQLDLRLGYTFDFGLYLGGSYALGSDKFVQHVGTFYIGPTIGYTKYNFYGLATYILASEQDLASGGIKYGKGTGYQLSLGYRLLIAEDTYIGPEFSYRLMKYDNRQVVGLAGESDRKDEHIYPSITLMFKF